MGLVKKFKLNPPDVLGALLSVDGENSQLDADMVDGKHYSDIINETQERIDDGVSAVSSALSGKADANHTHTPDSIGAAKKDLSNVSNEDFAAKAEAAGVGGDGQDLAGYATKEWVEGKGYLTAHQDITSKADTDLSNVSNEDFAAKAEAAGVGGEGQDLTGYATKEWVEGKGYLTAHQDITGKANTDLSNVTNEDFAAKAEAAGLGGCKITTGTYEGSTGGSGDTEKTLNFDFPPSLLVINTQKDASSETNVYSAVFVRGNTDAYVNSKASLSASNQAVSVSWNGNSVTLEGSPATAMCQRDETYYYFAIGIGEE